MIGVVLWGWNECWSMFFSSVLYDCFLLSAGVGSCGLHSMVLGSVTMYIECITSIVA